MFIRCSKKSGNVLGFVLLDAGYVQSGMQTRTMQRLLLNAKRNVMGPDLCTDADLSFLVWLGRNTDCTR